MSLSRWFRDYLYIPLGGNRGGRVRTYRNLLLTMLFGGLWHGAAWTFVAWGAFHGGLLIAHRTVRCYLGELAPVSGSAAWFWRAGSRVLTFHGVCVGWLLFRSPSLTHAGELLDRLLDPWHAGLVMGWMLPLAALIAPLVAMQLAQHLSGDLNVVRRCPVPVRAAVYAGMMLAITVFGEHHGQPFIYFQF